MNLSGLFFLFSFFFCFSAASTETIRFDQVSLHWKPEMAPRVFQGGLLFPDSKPKLGTEFHRSYMESLSEASESFVVLETEKGFAEVTSFYEKFFKENDWKILKKVEKEKSFVLLSESSTRRVVTVLVQEKGNQRIIKLFHKKQAAF